MLQKIEQEKLLIGGQMPSGGPPLSREQTEIIRQWISAEALPRHNHSLFISSLAYAENLLFQKDCIHPPPYGNDAELSDYSFAILGEAKTKGRRAFVTGKVTAWPLAGRRGQQQSLNCSQRRRGGAMRIPQ